MNLLMNQVSSFMDKENKTLHFVSYISGSLISHLKQSAYNSLGNLPNKNTFQSKLRHLVILEARLTHKLSCFFGFYTICNAHFPNVKVRIFLMITRWCRLKYRNSHLAIQEREILHTSQVLSKIIFNLIYIVTVLLKMGSKVNRIA